MPPPPEHHCHPPTTDSAISPPPTTKLNLVRATYRHLPSAFHQPIYLLWVMIPQCLPPPRWRRTREILLHRQHRRATMIPPTPTLPPPPIILPICCQGRYLSLTNPNARRARLPRVHHATRTLIGHAKNVPNPSAILSPATPPYDPRPRYHQLYFHTPSMYRLVNDEISTTSNGLPPNAFSAPTTAALSYAFATLPHPSPKTPSAYMLPFSFTRGLYAYLPLRCLVSPRPHQHPAHAGMTLMVG